MTDQVVTLRLTADAKGLIAGVQLAKRETDGLGGAGEKAGRQVSGAMNTATGALQRFAVQAAAAFSIRAMVRMADEYSNISARVKLATDSQQAFRAAMDQTYAIAQRTSTGLASTAELYGRMQKSADGLGRSQADALRATELINKSFQVSGTAAATANAAIIQLSQGLSAGALRGDEFNSVLEGSPRLAQALTDSMGIGIGQLRKMAEEGELTAQVIYDALLSQGDAIDAEFAQLPLTVGRAWTQIENAALAAIGKLDGVLGGSGALAASLQGLVELIEKVPRAIALWVEAVDRVGGEFDVVVQPIKDVIGDIADEFLILPVSLRTAATIIIGEFDQLRISAVEKFDLLVNGAERAWVALQASAAELSGQLKLIFARVIDEITRGFARMVGSFSGAASKAGLDELSGELGQMASNLRANANLEREVSREVAKANIAYAQKAAALEVARSSISATADAQRAASQAAVQGALDERDAALLQINAQEELAAASTATGEAMAGLGTEMDEVAKQGKDAKVSAQELSRAFRELNAAASDAERDLDGMLDDMAAQLGGPSVGAALDYRDALLRIADAEIALMALGPMTVETQAKIDEARRMSAQIYADRQADIRNEITETDRIAMAAAESSSRAWTDFAGDLVDAMGRGMDGVKDLFKRMLADLARQLLQSTVLRLMSSVFGGSMPGLAMAAGAGGQQSMLGAMLGVGGNSTGAAGGGLGLTGLISGFGQFLGPLAILAGASTGNRGMGALGGAVGGFTFASSAMGAGMLGGALSGTALGASLGSVVPVIGTVIGAVIGTLLSSAFENETILRVRSNEFNGDRRAKGIAESQLGSIFVRGESLGDGAAVKIAEQIKEFDNLIAGLLNEDQLAAVRERLSAVNDTFRDGAANVGEALDARFAAILGEMSADVQQFVGSADDLEERVKRLADALAIERIVDLDTIGGTFAEVGEFLEGYRQGTEDLGATYTRLMAGAQLFEAALDMAGTAFDGTRQELIAFAADITESAGGLERAQSLWSSYFESFYTETERQTYALQQAMQRASDLFTDAGLDLADYTGDGGAAAFRALFEQQLPTLSAAAVVQWLEMAEALGLVIDLSGQAGEAIEGYGETLADLMSGVTEQLAEFAPPPTFAQQLAAINTETESLIARATALGATEAELAQIRELGALRVGDVLAQQADAYRQYAELVRGLADEAADLRGLSEYQREMREVDRWTQETAAALNSAARAAGMQAAAEEDLALMHEIAAARAAAAMARLEQRGRDLVSQLYGSRLTELDAQIGDVGGAARDWMIGATGGMNDLTQATDTAVQALIGAQQRVRDWLNGIMSSELSGLRPRDRLTEMLALAERTRTAALGGDAEAFARMPQIADELLRLGRDVYASGSQYFDLRDMVRGWMQELANVVIPEPQPGPGGNLGGVDVGGNTYGGGAVVDLEREQMIAQQAAAERLALAQELAAVIRDLVVATGKPLDEIAATLGFAMSDLVADLGVNLSEMTVATASHLAGIASAMGVELTDLASSVGVSLGSLGDRQSLLNDALETTIGRLPAGQRDLLEPLLRDVEEAAALGDTAGVEAGIASMEDAIAEMAPELRDMLAPYFLAIGPADPATEIGHLSSIDGAMGATVGELMTHTSLLGDINASILSLGGLQPGPPLGGGIGPTPPPGYAVGTPWVPADGLAFLHRGEAVVPREVNAWLRRPVDALRPPGWVKPDSRDSAGVDALVRSTDETHRLLRAIEQRVQSLEQTTDRRAQDQVRAMERQTDAMRAR